MTPAYSGTCYLTYDMLGSPRLITDPNQNVVVRHDFISFGEEIPNGTAGRNGNFGYTSNVTQAFTGQEADGGTASLDFYNARHFAAAIGSFVQPDPCNAGADLLHPQSWNGYGYVLGNPLGAADPTGLDCASRGGLHANIVGCSGGGNYGSGDDPTGGGGGGVSIDGGATVPIGTFGGGNPAGGQYATTVTETTWVQNSGSTSPQNTEASWFTSGASASINYYPQSSSWVMSGARQYVVLSDNDPLGGSYARALSLVGQNIDAQYSFIGAVVGGSALVGATGGLAVNAISALPTMQVAVGTSPAPFHVIYGVGATGLLNPGTWQAALGPNGAMKITAVATDTLARYLSTNGYSVFNVPVMSTQGVLAELGSQASYCFSAGACAVLRGWGF